MNAIGIDLGGTNVKAVLISREGRIIDKAHVPIINNDWREAVLMAYSKMKPLSMTTYCVGLAAPGLPNDQNSQINHMPGRLDGLEQFNWSEFIKEPVHVLNDAHAALLAEVYFGVAKGKNNVVMLTLGTGVGGAILINGKLYQGTMQRAGSIGDMSLHAESEEIGYLQVPGTLEDSIGNETVPKRSGGRFQTSRSLVEAYANGDKMASEVWLRSVKRLAVALCSLINILAPELIVIGGGIAKSNQYLFGPLADFMNRYEWRPAGHATPIVKAHFDEYAGAIGAACFAFDKVENS